MGKTNRVTLRLATFFIASYAASCGGDSWRALHAPSTAHGLGAANSGTKEAPALHVVLNDPRLTAARDFQVARDFAAAARVVDDERAKGGLDASSSCQWAYASARLHALANEAAAASEAFDEASRAGCPLVSFATFRAAEAYAKAGNWQTSLARAQAVPDEFPLHDEARVTLAEALAGNGARLQAVAIWRELLSSHPHGVRWVDTAVRLATAILDGVEGDPAAKAREAYDLATRVYVEAPKVADGSGATALRTRATALVRAADASFSDQLTDDQLATRTQAWVDAGEPTRAVDEFNRAISSRPSGEKSKPGCQPLVAKAQAMMRTKALSADAWGDAITACDGDDELAIALFQGGKASVSAKRNPDAIARFDKLQDRFPHHRLADDAALREAAILQDDGDSQRAESKLLEIPDTYPDGDMGADALFRVALAHMTRGDWQGAAAPLDRAIALEGEDHKSVNMGRARYFRARVADATGDHTNALEAYAHIVETYPLSYFMLQSYARLATTSADLAKKTLDRAIAGAAATPPKSSVPSELFTDRAERARALLEVGEIEAARNELAPILGDGADLDLTIALGSMFEEANAADVGHAIVHGREFMPHYPAGEWKRAWEVAFPRAFFPYVGRESTADAVPMTLVYGIMREESRYFPDARSPANAFGLMQMIPPTAKMVASGTNLPWDEPSLTRADVSIALGTRMLGQLRAANPANPHLAIPSYNAGPKAVSRWLAERPTQDFDLWIEQIPFEETRAYIKKVLASQATYAFLYDPQSLPPLLALPAHVSGTP